jgi:hypothetical protein
VAVDPILLTVAEEATSNLEDALEHAEYRFALSNFVLREQKRKSELLTAQLDPVLKRARRSQSTEHVSESNDLDLGFGRVRPGAGGRTALSHEIWSGPCGRLLYGKQRRGRFDQLAVFTTSGTCFVFLTVSYVSSVARRESF